MGDEVSTKRTKHWTDEERVELAAKLDAQLDEYINNLEKKSYNEGWPEDRWQDEMEKHPFFMKKVPEPGAELSPLMEGLQQLKYSPDENTPEELAQNYKEDGNFNYKYKNYRLAILSYTEGIKTKCKDQELLAQLYNNRAAAHFMLKNYRSSLNDCKCALKIKLNYTKALNRAANCCLHMKDYDQCIALCDQLLLLNSTDKIIINLKKQAMLERECSKRNRRKRDKIEKQVEKERENLLRVIKSRNINLEKLEGCRNPDLKDLQPQIPQIAQSRVHLDEQNRLIWPVMILYPEVQQCDFIQNFHEDTVILEQLQELFVQPPEWDTNHHYIVENINVYFEGSDKYSVHKVDIHKTLGEILQDDRYIVRGGTAVFSILVKFSKAESKFLLHYSL